MNLNVFDYSIDGIPVNVIKTGDKPQDISRIPDHLHVDHRLLFPILANMPKYALRIYFNLLNRLEHNAQPIVVSQTLLRNEATPNLKNRTTFENHTNKLINSGLLIKGGRNTYYINPVFAWKEGSEACFNPDYIPTIETEQPTVQEEAPVETSEPLSFYKSGKKAGRVRNTNTRKYKPV